MHQQSFLLIISRKIIIIFEINLASEPNFINPIENFYVDIPAALL